MGQRILIVDDESSVGTTIQRLLTVNGFDAEYAKNLNDAFTFLQKRQYDVALIDLHMPDINGIDLAMLMMKKQSSINTILMSGAGTIEDYLLAQAVGVKEFLHKPFDPSMLVKVIAGL